MALNEGVEAIEDQASTVSSPPAQATVAETGQATFDDDRGCGRGEFLPTASAQGLFAGRRAQQIRSKRRCRPRAGPVSTGILTGRLDVACGDDYVSTDARHHLDRTVPE